MQGIKQEQKIVVGFKMVNNNFLRQQKEKLKIVQDPIELLEIIVNDYQDVLGLYEKLFLNQKDEKVFFGNFSYKEAKIHYEFVRKFLDVSIKKPFRTSFVELRVLKSVDKQKFIDWFKQNKELVESLEKSLTDLKNCKTTKISTLVQTIKKLNSNEGIFFVEKLTSSEGIDFTGEKMDTFLPIKQQINQKAARIKENLLKAEKVYLVKSNVGLNIFNGSLNYFSVNKKIDDYSNKKEKLKQQLDQPIGDKYNNDLKAFGSDFDLFNIFSGYFKEYGYNSLKETSLKDFRQILKNIKGKEKAKFLEDVYDLEFEDLKKNYPLFVFSNKESFENFKKFSQLIRNGKGNRDIAKKRGDFIDYKSGCCKTKKYANLNKLYEKVAKDYGNVNAKLKAIENIIDNIRKLQYWLVFAQINNEIKIIAIPKGENLENLKKANNFLIKGQEQKEEIKILLLNSFTLKALEKLLFREDSSFRQELSKEIDKRYLKYMRQRFLKTRSKQDNLTDRELVNFYQQTLKSKCARKNLKIDFNKIKSILVKNYDSVEDFRLDLEKELYGFIEIYLSLEEYQEFLKRFQAVEFKIVMIDTKKNPQSRWHKNLWPYFWSNKNQTNCFPIRINPEIKFFYKEKDKEKIQYLIDKFGKEKVFSPNFKHRFLEDRIIAKVNFEFNIPSQRLEFSFKERLDIEQEIEKFNRRYNEINPNYQNAYYFGIDRGQAEFVSLGIYQINGAKCNRERIKVYQIKDKYLGKLITSQKKWLDWQKYFDELELDHLDLTVAKLVDGHIVINSEIKTLLELYKINYKIRIFELADEIAEDNFFIKSEENKDDAIYAKTTKQKQPEQKLGHYKAVFAKFDGGELKEILTELKDYYLRVKKSRIFSEYEMQLEKTVNYKNALAANAVGVMDFLRRKYNNVYFVLENLDLGEIKRQSQQRVQAIHRQLEWVLLNKLRKKGLVPSDISKQIIFRDNKKDKQFGPVLFLEKKKTSRVCPNCEAENMGGYSGKEFNKAKFQQRQIKCKKCGAKFHPDEIACMNLAKKGYNFLVEKMRNIN